MGWRFEIDFFVAIFYCSKLEKTCLIELSSTYRCKHETINFEKTLIVYRFLIIWGFYVITLLMNQSNINVFYHNHKIVFLVISTPGHLNEKLFIDNIIKNFSPFHCILMVCHKSINLYIKMHAIKINEYIN